MSDEDIDFLLKIVIIGDSGVGKTNLLSRFTRDTFSNETRNTIGVDFSAKDIQLKGKTVKVQFWDTAGQEKYRAIASAYYRNAHGAIIVYDITRRESFENLNTWLTELRENGNEDLSIIVLGNKLDLIHDREINTEDGKAFAQTKNCYFMEVSGKENKDKCVNKAFNTVLEEIVKKQEKEDMSRTENELFNFQRHNINKRTDFTNEYKTKQKRCC